MAILATGAAVTLSPREQTFADIIGLIDDAVSGDSITSVELADMILETVEKNMRETRVIPHDMEDAFRKAWVGA